jgi:hypothetical protein
MSERSARAGLFSYPKEISKISFSIFTRIMCDFVCSLPIYLQFSVHKGQTAPSSEVKPSFCPTFSLEKVV